MLDGLRQAGCLKARFPRRDDPGWLNIVTLNISGGIAGGDVLDEFVLVATRRASPSRRRRRSGSTVPARQRASACADTVTVGARRGREWLPQETILFDRCSLRRHLRSKLAEDAWFLGVECLVFGRGGDGRGCRAGHRFAMCIEVRRGGRLLLHDTIRLDGTIAAMLQRPAIADGARAIATMVHVAPDAEGSAGCGRATGVASNAASAPGMAC